MLQRVQSIFLFFVSMAMIAMLFLTIWQKTSANDGEMVQLTAFNLTHTASAVSAEASKIISKTHTFYIAIFGVLAAISSFYSIFQFKNRLTQIKLGALNSFLIAGAMGTSLYFSMQGEKLLAPEVQGTYQLGFFMPAMALIFNLLANRFIRRDEKLVKSVDRLR